MWFSLILQTGEKAKIKTVLSSEKERYTGRNRDRGRKDLGPKKERYR